MQDQERFAEKHFTLNLDSSGRVVLPATTALRKSLKEGETLVAVEKPDGSLSIKTHAQVIRDVQDMFAQYIKPGESWSEELIRERREEAARE